MSFFKRTFNKTKKGVKKSVNKVKKAANKSAKKIEKVSDKRVDKLKKVAEFSKEGLEKAGDFLLNSSEREYWNKEISRLKNRLNKLREELNNKINTYFDVRIDYQEKIHYYSTIKQDTIALGLVSSEKLDTVTDTTGVIVDTTRDFRESNSEIEAIGRYALGFVSAGISDMVFASQEAKKEAKYLKQQIFILEEHIEKIDNNIDNHKKGIVLINQSVTEILQLYGDDTTIDNFVSRQCKLIYEQAKEVKVQETIIRMQGKGVTQQEIEAMVGYGVTY